MGFSLRAEDYSDWEAGPYMAKLVDAEPETDAWDFGPSILWKFEITEAGEYQGRTLPRRTSQAFSPRANSRKFAEALLNRTISGGEELVLEDLIGKPCNIQVSLRQGERGTFANIDLVAPLRKNQQGKGVTPQSEAEAESEAELDEIPF